MLSRIIAGFGVIALCGQALAENAPSNEELFRMLKAQQRELAQQQDTIRGLKSELQRSRQQASAGQSRTQNGSNAPAPARGTAEAAAADAMAAHIPAKAQPWSHAPVTSWAGVVGGAEFVHMKTFYSEDFLTTSNQGGQYNPGYRYWLGLESATGLGARARYWRLQGTDHFSPATYVAVKYQTLDVEFYKRFDFSQGNFLLAAGYRNAAAENDINANRSRFRGHGLTVAVEGAANVLATDWLQATGGARWSAMFGDSEDFTGGVPTNRDRSDLAQIVELRVGGQINHRFAHGGKVSFGAGAEGQYWSNGASDDTQDLGFFGFYVNGSYKHPF
jgi:hypothetical protein